MSYGNFPPFAGAQATVFAAINQFPQIGQGTIRDTYTDPSVDTSSSQLRDYLGSIEKAR